MPINFPDSPSLNDTHTVGDKTWIYNGSSWDVVIANQAPNQLRDADNDTKIEAENTTDDDTLRFSTAGTERMTITSAGHLIPSADVTYDLGSATNRFRDLYLSGSSIDLGGVTISSDGTNLTLPPVSNINGDLTVGTDVLHVDHANSRVGIGTTTPNVPLTVEHNNTYGMSLASTGTYSFLNLSDATSSGYNYVGLGALGDELRISAGGSQRMAIDASGNVGINTTSPAHRLDVNGTINTSSYVRVGGEAALILSGSTIQVGSAASNMSLSLNAGAVDRLFINSSGNVGIATSTPAATLDVNGSLKATNSYVDAVGPTTMNAGWYTIATCISGRASARFDLHDPTSGRHQSTTFYVTTVYGQDGITVISHGYYSGGGPFQYIRVKGISVYDGAAVQVYARATAYTVRLYMSDNYNEQRWVLKNFIPDATDPGGLQGTWSSFTQQVVVNLDSCGSGGGTIQTGPVNASAKNFSIPHPTREDYMLSHGALEGPEQAVYHRGTCTDGVIRLPDYWDGLVDLDTITVHLTAMGDYVNYVESVDGLDINVVGGSCYFVVYGERKDIAKLEVETPMYSAVEPVAEGAP